VILWQCGEGLLYIFHLAEMVAATRVTKSQKQDLWPISDIDENSLVPPFLLAAVVFVATTHILLHCLNPLSPAHYPTGRRLFLVVFVFCDTSRICLCGTSFLSSLPLLFSHTWVGI